MAPPIRPISSDVFSLPLEAGQVTQAEDVEPSPDGYEPPPQITSFDLIPFTQCSPNHPELGKAYITSAPDAKGDGQLRSPEDGTLPQDANTIEEGATIEEDATSGTTETTDTFTTDTSITDISTPDIPAPAPICELKVSLPKDSPITDIAAGGDVTCLIKSGTVYCTGRIDKSGDPLTHHLNETSFKSIPGWTNALRVVTGGNHICAIFQSGAVQCLGENLWGQLGNGNKLDSKEGVLVKNLATAVSLATGRFHSCALDVGGKISCWGLNVSGQLGGGTQQAVPLPAEITTLSDMTDLAAGDLHSCAIHKSGASYCWGNNSAGQTGAAGSKPKVFTPLIIEKAIHRIAAGGDVSCFVDETCHVGCAGSNAFGQLGSGTIDKDKDLGKKNPLTVIKSLNDLADIGAGGQHACAITQEGALYCWGNNEFGQIGNSKASDAVSTPTLISGMQPIVRVAAGGNHTCALDTSGTVYCWGRNQSGQLGTGTTKDSTAPIQINI